MAIPTNVTATASVPGLMLATITASWDEVEGASAYSISVRDPDDNPVGGAYVEAPGTESTTQTLVSETMTVTVLVSALIDGVFGPYSDPVEVDVVVPSLAPPVEVSEIDQVRALIPDMDPTDQIFTDDHIRIYLGIYGNNVRRAAAAAINAISIDEVLLLKVVRTDDLQVSGHLVAEALRKRAKDLTDEADLIDANEAGDIFVIAGGFPRYTARPPEGTPWPWRV